MTTTEIRGELVALGWNAEVDSNRAVVRCTLGAIEALEPNLTLQGPTSVALLAAAELDALRAELDALRADLKRIKENGGNFTGSGLCRYDGAWCADIARDALATAERAKEAPPCS
jgi:hypothetical protein